MPNGGHLGNDVIEKKGSLKDFFLRQNDITRLYRYQNRPNLTWVFFIRLEYVQPRGVFGGKIGGGGGLASIWKDRDAIRISFLGRHFENIRQIYLKNITKTPRNCSLLCEKETKGRNFYIYSVFILQY